MHLCKCELRYIFNYLEKNREIIEKKKRIIIIYYNILQYIIVYFISLIEKKETERYF